MLTLCESCKHTTRHFLSLISYAIVMLDPRTRSSKTDKRPDSLQSQIFATDRENRGWRSREGATPREEEDSAEALSFDEYGIITSFPKME